MPYIKEKRAQLIGRGLDKPEAIGELNFLITRNCQEFLGDEYGYTELNQIIGVLECAKQEFYRRVLAEYEDKKMHENGDVFKRNRD